MDEMPTEFDDLPATEQMRVEKHILVALEAVGLDHHYIEPMIDALDEAVEAARHE